MLPPPRHNPSICQGPGPGCPSPPLLGQPSFCPAHWSPTQKSSPFLGVRMEIHITEVNHRHQPSRLALTPLLPPDLQAGSPVGLYTRDQVCQAPLKYLLFCSYLYDNSWRLGYFPAFCDWLCLSEISRAASCHCVHVCRRLCTCTYGLITHMLMTACRHMCTHISVCVMRVV